MEFFLGKLFSPEERFIYFSWILVVIISVVLHELAHGIAAIRFGDDTPIRMNRMTPNPIVHMGPYSLFLLFVFGIAWGAMPVDPTKLKGKYAESIVAASGPATNLLLAVLAIVAAGLMLRFGYVSKESEPTVNAVNFLYIAGYVNLILMAFNLFPVPPLDGSKIMSNLVPSYKRLTYDPAQQGMWMVAFIFTFAVMWQLVPKFVDFTIYAIRFVATS
ncbi:site-2 protease family protein [Planctomycetota bacterium]|nr:site-2 protease family protein [Planctomycetota bacterium]